MLLFIIHLFRFSLNIEPYLSYLFLLFANCSVFQLCVGGKQDTLLLFLFKTTV